MKINLYLTFNGNCEEAMNYYRDCFGGHFSFLSRFEDGPEELAGKRVPDDLKDRIMHLTWNLSDTVIMASDSLEEVPFGQNTTLSVYADSLGELERCFEHMSTGGTVQLPLQDTFWGSRFGMLTDQFGVQWMFSYDLTKK